MKIQEQPAANNLAGILEQFANLPSSFPNYTQQMTSLEPPLTEEEQKEYQQAKQWYFNGPELLQDGHYQQALESFSKAEENIPDARQDSDLSVWAEMKSAFCYQHLGESLTAVSKLEKTIEKAASRINCYYELENCYKDLIKILGHLDSLEDTPKQPKNLLETYEQEQINNLLKSVYPIDEQRELKARLALGALHRYYGEHAEAISQYNKAYLLRQGMLDYSAYKVAQGEVGFSDYHSIGTDNIRECVVVILHDPKTHKTALAHIDEYTDINSLYTDVISQFPADRPLTAYLVGGIAGGSKLAISDKNITKVTQELQKHHNINVVAADIGDKGAPHAIVFNPLTKVIAQKVPAKRDDTIYLRQVRRQLGFNQNPYHLVCAFDLTESKNINVPPLNVAQQQKVINSLIVKLTTNFNDTTEAWYANQELTPVVKVAEEIRQNNPSLCTDIFEQMVSDRLSEIKVSQDEELPLKTSLSYYINQLINDKRKPLADTMVTLIKDVIGIDNIETRKKILEIYSNHISQDLQPIGQKLQKAGLLLLNATSAIEHVSSNPVPNISNTANINLSKPQLTNKQGLSR